MTKQTQKRTLDPAKTRETILEAAVGLFADKGYSGTSIAGIAAAAGVPKSLVQYHFGNKEELWQACLANRTAPLIAAVDRFVNGESTEVADLVEARFKLLREHPEVRKLLTWASMESVPTPQFLGEQRARFFRLLRAEQSGPDFLRLMLAIAATDGWFMYRDLYRRFIGEAIVDEQVEDRLFELIMKVVSEK